MALVLIRSKCALMGELYGLVLVRGIVYKNREWGGGVGRDLDAGRPHPSCYGISQPRPPCSIRR